MLKKVFLSFVAVLAIAAAAAGPVRGQNASPDVTLDFTDNTSWDFPTSYTMNENTYTSGDYTITLYSPNGGSNGYRFISNDPSYLILGQQNAYLELPAFSSPVEKIEVVGRKGASPQVHHNIYVGDVAVSTETIGDAINNQKDTTQTYVIDENYRAAGTHYRLKVTSSGHRTQITYIKVYFAPAPVPITVRMAEGTEDAANWTLASGNASVPGNQVLENVMSGSQVTATYNGTTKKVKSVKAVKYVAPAATVATEPAATGATIAANSTSALVNAGAASGGTMMYAVTATNAQPASTADFSADIPTAQGLTAGTYYVWYYVEGDASHTDSEISATAIAVTIAAAETTVTWTSSDMTSNFYAYFDGWTNNNTHQGITVTASGDANSGWGQNNIDVNDGSGTITFTSSVGNIKSIVISAVYLNNMDMSVPTGWTANEPWNNPRTLSWSGTASATVNLPLSNMQNIGGISTIVFTLE